MLNEPLSALLARVEVRKVARKMLRELQENFNNTIGEDAAYYDAQMFGIERLCDQLGIPEEELYE
jgi:hypothetical protein